MMHKIVFVALLLVLLHLVSAQVPSPSPPPGPQPSQPPGPMPSQPGPMPSQPGPMPSKPPGPMPSPKASPKPPAPTFIVQKFFVNSSCVDSPAVGLEFQPSGSATCSTTCVDTQGTTNTSTTCVASNVMIPPFTATNFSIAGITPGLYLAQYTYTDLNCMIPAPGGMIPPFALAPFSTSCTQNPKNINGYTKHSQNATHVIVSNYIDSMCTTAVFTIEAPKGECIQILNISARVQLMTATPAPQPQPSAPSGNAFTTTFASFIALSLALASILI